ncbi:MAG: hypothetical protein A2521_14565 [Deltaproteobacteria bacterium RIFOXYD12_FULL_57_12]|nr:MAG: hypothetical protein A2521_14565 [Deltaproteobacteria bacterium RIFOXYD12_FULL_57_12]
MHGRLNFVAGRSERSVMPKSGRGRQKGFTLLEVLVATVILGLSYVAILQNFSLSAKNISRLGQKRTDMFMNALLFENSLLADQEDPTTEPDQTIYLEGLQFRLVLVADEEQGFVTLKLEKNKL